ncbi:DUF1766-domain-containing protein [Phaeosphaeriaceae sp. SRC1lsM3a]|nr:DUF1766-domain-containing protein [Stagonospora sp. SRC1lsM3a]
MAFTGRTPEALIPRSDSRNPATTCKGITKSGRPCRRPIDAKASQDDGVLAVVSVVSDEDSEEEIGAAAYFCWQHKDQAESLAAQASSGPATHLYPLKERHSIDTLVERLGVLEVDESVPEIRKKRRDSGQRDHNRTSGPRPPRRINRPPTWDNIEGPLISVPSDVMVAEKRRTRPPKPAPQPQKPSFWSSLCCGSADDDHVEVVQKAARPLNKTTRADSETAQLLRYIPQTLSPQLTSTLLAELSKPISPHDDEGYIYIFWLTPDASGPAPSSAASALLAPPTRPDQGRRTSDVLRQYSVKQRPGTSRQRSGEKSLPDTIFLKIGRANNVHRRMNEWTRQCGYSLSLVRYYPYVPSTPSPTPSPQTSPTNSRRQSYQNGGRRVSEGVRKVPHAHRVERLIHLELGAQRVMKNCDACGKTHKEWFEVEASREGVKKVDDVVKRWVEWAEKASE